MEPRDRYEEIADDLVARNDDVELAKMMGMPCVKRAGKMVAGFAASSGAMVFKLTDADQRDAGARGSRGSMARVRRGCDRHAFWVNHLPCSSSWKTTAFWPLSRTTSK